MVPEELTQSCSALSNTARPTVSVGGPAYRGWAWEDEMYDCYHLTEGNLSYSVGTCEGPPHRTRQIDTRQELIGGEVVDVPAGPDVTVAPGQWVEAYLAAKSLEHVDVDIRVAVIEWARFCSRADVLDALSVGAMGEIETILWCEYGIYGQDASVIVGEAASLVGREKIAAGAC